MRQRGQELDCMNRLKALGVKLSLDDFNAIHLWRACRDCHWMKSRSTGVLFAADRPAVPTH